MPEPSRKPPEPAREHSVVLVVSDDLHAPAAGIADPESSERLRQHQRIGQRMASVRPSRWTGKIVVQVRIDGSRNMTNRVFTFAPPVVVQLEATIDDN